MANWANPVLTSTYANFVTEVKDRDVDTALWFEGSTSTNVPTNAKRYDATSHTFQKWNGTAWVAIDTSFSFPALTVSGGTVNGIGYLNASKAFTTSAALAFDGTTLSMTPTANVTALYFANSSVTKTDTTTQLFERTYTPTGTSSIYSVGTFSFKGKDNGGTTHTLADIVVTGTAFSAFPTRAYGVLSFNAYNYTGVVGASLQISNGYAQLDPDGAGSYFIWNNASFTPPTNGAQNLGSATNMWNNIYANGSVGIGTSSPGVKLHVAGSGRFTGFDTGYYNENVLAIGNASFNPKLGMASNSGYRWNTRIRDVGGSGEYVVRYEEGSLDALVIDRSGNLGLGVTPSAWSSGGNLQFPLGALSSSAALGTALNLNAYYNAGWKYQFSNTLALLYQQGGNGHVWFNAPSGTAGAAISFTQAMTLDASGNLGVGTSSPAGRLHIRQDTINAYFQCDNTGSITLNFGGTTTPNKGRILYSDNADLFAFYTNSTERARIDSAGQLHTQSTTGVVRAAYAARAFVNFDGTGTVAIRSNGNVTSITDNGVGDYTVNYTTAMTSANYSVNVTAVNSASGNSNVICAAIRAPSSAGVGAASVTTGSVRISVRTSSGNQIDSDCVNVAIFM